MNGRSNDRAWAWRQARYGGAVRRRELQGSEAADVERGEQQRGPSRAPSPSP